MSSLYRSLGVWIGKAAPCSSHKYFLAESGVTSRRHAVPGDSLVAPRPSAYLRPSWDRGLVRRCGAINSTSSAAWHRLCHEVARVPEAPRRTIWSQRPLAEPLPPLRPRPSRLIRPGVSGSRSGSGDGRSGRADSASGARPCAMRRIHTGPPVGSVRTAAPIVAYPRS